MISPDRRLGRGGLWLGFLGAFLALAFILVLQYGWLRRLEGTSALAGRALLGSVLEAVTTEVLYFYGPQAERALDVPVSLVSGGDAGRAAAHFRRQRIEGAKVLFAVRFEPEERGSLSFYDPGSGEAYEPEPSAETRAVTLACAPWRLMYDKGIEVEVARPSVEERDPDHRIILSPILNSASRVVGVAGMIVDTKAFTEEILPRIVRTSLPRVLGAGREETVLLTARDARGARRFVSGPDAQGRDRSADPAASLARPFAFVFTDWTLAIESRRATPEQLARATFLLNLALSGAAAVMLVGGLALALRTAAREMRLSRMKSDFVANVSHELRTPLASIRLFGELMRMGRASDPDRIREYGARIEAESRRLTALIDNILDVARIESGRKTYAFVQDDVTRIADEVLGELRERLAHEGFALEVIRPASPLPSVRIDPSAFAQVLHNLVDNAVKYSGESRWIGVRLGSEGRTVRISVEDRGVGIPGDELPHIFERFHRVGNGLQQGARGSGLGLALVDHIIAAHGGRVLVESEPGRGSIFTVELPALEGS